MSQKDLAGMGTHIVTRLKEPGVAFLVSAVATGLFLFALNPAATPRAIAILQTQTMQLIPVLVSMIALQFLSRLLLPPEQLMKLIAGSTGAKQWYYAVMGSIFSGHDTEGIKRMAELRNNGVREGVIAASLFNGAVKLPFLPFLIHYFGWRMTGMIIIAVAVGAVIIGFLVENALVRVAARAE